jgi:hypothetical protein
MAEEGRRTGCEPIGAGLEDHDEVADLRGWQLDAVGQ